MPINTSIHYYLKDVYLNSYVTSDNTSFILANKIIWGFLNSNLQAERNYFVKLKCVFNRADCESIFFRNYSILNAKHSLIKTSNLLNESHKTITGLLFSKSQRHESPHTNRKNKTDSMFTITFLIYIYKDSKSCTQHQ